MAAFSETILFTKGICYAEFFDPETDALLASSSYVTDFSIRGSMNTGEVSGGPGNALVMCIPDTTRLTVTARTADSDLRKLALGIGASVSGGSVQEITRAVTAGSGGTLTLTGSVTAPPGSSASTALAYILRSSGSDTAAVQAASGSPYPVSAAGLVQDFTGLEGASYIVKYFVTASGSPRVDIPALFAPRVVRAHFAVNLYSRSAGESVLRSSVIGRRHYYIPYYFFTSPWTDTASQTATGSVDLSGMALTWEQVGATGVTQSYGTVADEYFDSATAAIEGLYIVGEGGALTLARNASHALTLMYAVDGRLTPVTDLSEVTFASTNSAIADAAAGTVTAKATAGSAVVTVSAVNSSTGVTYSDAVMVTVT